MESFAKRHDNLLELITHISEEDPLLALRLLQVRGVNKFGHILSIVTPETSADFCAQPDAAIIATFGAIQGILVDPATSTHDLPVVAGGAGLPSLSRTAFVNYLGAFFSVSRPFIDRLSHMGGTYIARAALLLEDPIAPNAGRGWAASIHSAHQAAL